MTFELLEMVNTNRSDASHKVTKAIYAIEDATNGIDNTVAALGYYVKISSRKDTDLFKSVTSGRREIARKDLVSAELTLHRDIEEEYYPLLLDIKLFIEFIEGKTLVPKKLVNKMRFSRDKLKELISTARYFENQISALL